MTPLTPSERAKLVAAGLIQMPVSAPLPKGRPPIVRLPKPEGRPLPKFIIAPAEATAPARTSRDPRPTGDRPTETECRAGNICIYCRAKPAIYYGPEAGYGAGCPVCTVINRAKNKGRAAE